LLLARHHVLLAEEAAIRSVQFGDVAEVCLWRTSEITTYCSSMGFPSNNVILRDQAVRAFSEEDLVTELDRCLHLTAFDEVRVGLKIE